MLGKDERDAECVIVRRFLEQTRLWVSSWLDGSPTVDPGWPKNASVRGALALAFPVRPRYTVYSTTWSRFGSEKLPPPNNFVQVYNRGPW